MNKISILFLMLMLISTSAVAKQSSFVDNSQSVTVQPNRSSDVSTPIMPDSYDIEVDGLYYKITSISDLTVALVGGEGVYKDFIVIPSELEYRGKKLKVTSIGDKAFFNSNVTNVTIGENVKEIGQYAFSKSAISKIVIPSSVITLRKYSFDGCNRLVDVNFEDGERELRFDYSSGEVPVYFEGCPIRKLYIGRTIDHWANPAFDDLSNTLEIKIGPYVKSLNEHLLKGASKISSLRIPASVTYLGKGAFDGCVSLKSVIFEDGTNTLLYATSGGYDSAVFEDSPLNYVYIGRNFRKKYSSVFSVFNHTPITQIDISCVVTELDELSHLDKLKEINIPSSVTKILGSGFYGCDNLSRIVCNSTVPPTFETYREGFSNSVFANGILYVPTGCVKAYEDAKVWGNFFDIQEISLSGINDVSNDGQENQTNAFYDVNGIKHKNLVKGLNVTKTKNGIVKKIYVK